LKDRLRRASLRRRIRLVCGLAMTAITPIDAPSGPTFMRLDRGRTFGVRSHFDREYLCVPPLISIRDMRHFGFGREAAAVRDGNGEVEGAGDDG
jgi:hypothetical protein